MSETEIAEFESQTDWRAMVELRIADDNAKVAGVRVPSLDSWEPIVRMVAERVR
jgi:predicted HD phosphohydrolase